MKAAWLFAGLCAAAMARAEAPLPPWIALQQVALTHASQGRFETSLQKAEEALSEAQGAMGKASPELIPFLLNAATAQRRLARYDEAQENGRWALALAQKYLDPQEPLLERAARDLANLCRERGLHDQAEALYLEALQSGGSPELSLERARLRRQRGKLSEAAEFYKEALGFKSVVPGPWLEDSILEYGRLLFESGQITESRKNFEAVLAVRRKRLPAGHVDIAVPLEDLGRVELLQGHPTKANELFGSAEAMRKGTLGPDSWLSLSYLDGAGELYRLMGRFDESTALLSRCVAINIKALGPQHPSVARALRRLGQAQFDAKKGAEARQSWLKAKDILVSNFPAHDLRVKQLDARLSGTAR